MSDELAKLRAALEKIGEIIDAMRPPLDEMGEDGGVYKAIVVRPVDVPDWNREAQRKVIDRARKGE